GPGQYVLGSAKAAKVALPGPRIACMVTFDGAAVQVEDVAGEGMLVNGRPAEHATVAKGDLVGIGAYKLAFTIAAPTSDSGFAGAKTQVEISPFEKELAGHRSPPPEPSYSRVRVVTPLPNVIVEDLPTRSMRPEDYQQPPKL